MIKNITHKLLLAFVIIFLFSNNSCKKEEPFKIVVNTAELYDPTFTYIRGGGNIYAPEGFSILTCGLCWDTIINPTINNNYSVEKDSGVRFTGFINKVYNNKKYYVRAYFTDSLGTYYGQNREFTLWINKPEEPVTDIDGNVYKTVRIGNQIWMKSNLRTTRYPDGEKIPYVHGEKAWSFLNDTSDAYCWYDNDSLNNAEVYGALYTWAAAMKKDTYDYYNHNKVQGACPDGWHIPSRFEWFELSDYFWGYEYAGIYLKELGYEHWKQGFYVGIDLSGFTATPAGYRMIDGIYAELTTKTDYWTANNGNDFFWLHYDVRFFGYGGPTWPRMGFSVRCIKD